MKGASLRKIFKYFSSVTIDDRDLMTPTDFVRSITPCIPPDPQTVPINQRNSGSNKNRDELSSNDQDPKKLNFFSFGDVTNPRFITTN